MSIIITVPTGLRRRVSWFLGREVCAVTVHADGGVTDEVTAVSGNVLPFVLTEVVHDAEATGDTLRQSSIAIDVRVGQIHGGIERAV